MRSVMIVGGGRVGASLAAVLADAGNAVTLLERDRDRGTELRSALHGLNVVTGDGTDPGALETHGVHVTDVLAAVTAADETNALACALARFGFGVPRTIARLVDPAHRWLLTSEIGVDVTLDQSELLSRLIAEEMSLGEVATLTRLRRGAYSLVEERVPAGAGAIGRRLDELVAPPGGVLVAVLRDDLVLPSTHGVLLEEDDEVLAVVPEGAAPELARVLDEGRVRA